MDLKEQGGQFEILHSPHSRRQECPQGNTFRQGALHDWIKVTNPFCFVFTIIKLKIHQNLTWRTTSFKMANGTTIMSTIQFLWTWFNAFQHFMFLIFWMTESWT
jgi:F0F1-type ATP synthase assembly protein I